MKSHFVVIDCLKQAMVKDKLYLNPNLSLSQLAYHINIPPYYLSMIFKFLNTNFYDYINSYRVKEVIEKLSDEKNDKYNIVALAFESGFNSKASFQRIFKNHTGMTPTEYKNNIIRLDCKKDIAFS